jgi:predicted ATP-grasp superfamily ATP-dependent carboligase
LPGRKWTVEDLDAASSIRYWRDLTVGEWLRSFRGIRESAFFAPDDLRPLLAMCMNDFRALFHRFAESSDAQSLPSLTPLLSRDKNDTAKENQLITR